MELVDVLDENGNKTGEKATLDDICNRGLWHNSVHAIIITKDRKIVAQKRSLSIVMNPDMIELSVGGAVNSAEEPLQAIIRETKEELGIYVEPSEVIYINKRRYNKHYKKLNKTSKTILHTYVIKLRSPISNTKLQDSETSKIYFLSESKAKRLVSYHRIARLGRITPFYSYWKFSLDEAIKFMHPTIHFVCRGNVFRSRIAKEYLAKHSEGIKIISSGIMADHKLFGSISHHAKALMKQHGLEDHQKKWVQTTQRNIDSSTLVIFMSQTILADAKKMIDLTNTKYLVWNIKDISPNSKENNTEKAEQIYQSITEEIKKLQKLDIYKNLL